MYWQDGAALSIDEPSLHYWGWEGGRQTKEISITKINPKIRFVAPNLRKYTSVKYVHNKTQKILKKQPSRIFDTEDVL